jgi:hypothetical protein
LNEGIKRLARYAAGLAFGLVLATGVYFLWQGAARPPAESASSSAASAPATNSKSRDASSDNPDIPNPKADLAIQAIAKARRLAADGNFAEAEAELKKADEAVPDMPQTKEARDEVAVLQTPQGQLRLQLSRAELAIERNDGGAAEAALAKAELIAPDSPEIAPLRQRLADLQQHKLRHDNRLTALLTAMREAIARQDFAAADDALNQAERLDVSNPDVLKARIELNRAHNAAMKEKEAAPVPSPTAPR